MKHLPSVSIIVLNWNGRDLLEKCLPSLLAQDYPHYTVVLVDNGSTDDSLSLAQDQFPRVNIIANRQNLGFSKGINVGLRAVKSEVVVLANNDVEAPPGWLAALVKPLVEEPAIGIAGCKLLYPDRQRIQHAGARLTYPLAYSEHYHYQEEDSGQADEIRDVDYVTGAAMAISRRVLENVGLLDEGFSPFYYEEVDFCYRAREAGYRVVYNPQAVAIHHEGVSMGRVTGLHAYTFHKNRLRFVLKHYSAEEFLQAFVPAEIKRLQESPTQEDCHLIRRIYLETLLSLAPILRQRQEMERLAEFQTGLLQLREAVPVHEASRQEPLDKTGWPYDELAQRLAFREPTFQSDKAVIGPLIVAVREAWNNVSARWYVWDLIKQQAAFNGLAAEIFAEQDKRLAAQLKEDKALAQEDAVLAQKLLAAQIRLEEIGATLGQRLTDLERRLERLEQAVEEKGDGKVSL